MSDVTFRIPKQTDDNLIRSLQQIAEAISGCEPVVMVCPHPGAGMQSVLSEKTIDADFIATLRKANSYIATKFAINANHKNGRAEALTISRDMRVSFDTLTIDWDTWASHLPDKSRSAIYITLITKAREILRASDAEAVFDGGEEPWKQYRSAQAQILNSLSEFGVTLNNKLADSAAKWEHEFLERWRAKSSELDAEYKARLDDLEKQKAGTAASLDEREKAIAKREAEFDRMEPGLRARVKQQEQIKAIESRLEKWNLTRTTQVYHWIVNGLCLVAAGVCLWLTFRFGSDVNDILQKQPLVDIHWWQWLLLTSKVLAPFGFFIAFAVFLVRWMSAWARRHADEEFNNWTRLLDIGRAAWLLESVRYARENTEHLPEPLLRELSRNLFANQQPSAPHPDGLSNPVVDVFKNLGVHIRAGDAELKVDSSTPPKPKKS